jgi:hypothetical protein
MLHLIINPVSLCRRRGGKIYKLDGTTGVQEWVFQTGDHIQAKPYATDSALFVGSWDRYFLRDRCQHRVANMAAFCERVEIFCAGNCLSDRL